MATEKTPLHVKTGTDLLYCFGKVVDGIGADLSLHGELPPPDKFTQRILLLRMKESSSDT